MPARKPRAATVDKAKEGLAEFLKMAGVDTTELQASIDALGTRERDYTPREHHEYKTLQAEGVLLIAESQAKALMHKKCKRQECGEIFMTRYNGVAYCSDLCRGKEMETRIGVRWNYSIDRYEAIGVDRPLVVGPQAYQALLEMARRIVEGHQALELLEQESHQENDEPHTSPEPVLLILDDPLAPESKPEEDPFGF